MNIREVDGMVYFHHKGVHNHARTHELRATREGREAFNKTVDENPEATPKQLVNGSEKRAPVTTHHVTYLHLGKTQKERQKRLQETAASRVTDTL